MRWDREAGLVVEEGIDALDILGDTVVFVSRSGSGTVEIYSRTDRQWSLQQKFPVPQELQQGKKVIKLGENFLLLGASTISPETQLWESGPVFISERTGAAWTELKRLTVNAGSNPVNMSGAFAIDGARIAIANEISQTVSVLAKQSAAWSVTDSFSFASQSIMQGCFQGALGMSGTAIQVILPCDDAFYDYVNSAASWMRTRIAFPEPPETSLVDPFIAFSGSLGIVLGHVYSRESGQWIPQTVKEPGIRYHLTPLALNSESDRVLMVSSTDLQLLNYLNNY